MKKLILIYFSLATCLTYSQTTEDSLNLSDNDSIESVSAYSLMEELPNMFIIPNTQPSPQAEAFTRLGEYQVTNDYGAPDISIPLFNVDCAGFSYPIALRYEAQPLKPGYNYDVTGIGWTLSGNSCVSRTIRDRADEIPLYNNAFQLDNFIDQSGHERLYRHYSSELNMLNFQYDSYNAVLPSGRVIPFFMYKDGYDVKFDLLPTDADIRIEYTYITTPYTITSFIITDEGGVVYHFDIADKSANRFLNDENRFVYVTWMLSRVDLPAGEPTAQEHIYYTYRDPTDITTCFLDEPVLHINRLYSNVIEDGPEVGYHFNITPQRLCCRYLMRFVSSITYNTTRISFNYSSDGMHLQDMTITDSENVYRRYSFTIDDSLLKKLVVTGDNDVDKLVYKFEYTGCIGHYTTDFWGNLCYGSSNFDIGNFNIHFDWNGETIDNFDIHLCNQTNGHVRLLENGPDDIQRYFKVKLQNSLNGDDRTPAPPEYHKVLRRITYPNGGQTYFEYENHKFLTATSSDGDMEFDRRKQRVMEGGGFRIKSIINYTADGGIADQRHYRYGYTYGQIQNETLPFPLPDSFNTDDYSGLGEAVVDPNLFTFLDYSYSPRRIPSGFMNMLLGIHTDGYPTFEDYGVGDGGAWWWDATFSAIKFRNLLNGRKPVVYPEITVFYGDPSREDCIGKTVYKYDIYSYNLSHERYYLSDYTPINGPDTAYFEPIHYINYPSSGMICEENPGKRHQLLSKTDYSKRIHSDGIVDWAITREEKYDYSEELFYKTGFMFNSYVSRGHCWRHTLDYGLGRDTINLPLSTFYTPTKCYMGTSKLSKKEIRIQYGSNLRDLSDPIIERYTYAFGGKIRKREYIDIYPYTDTYTFSGDNTDENDIVAVEMRNRNMLNVVTSKYTTYNYSGYPIITNGNKIEYAISDNGCILPKILYKINSAGFSDSIQIVSCYDFYSPLETIDINTGIHNVYFRDYSKRYVTGIIKGATLSEICSVLGVSVIPVCLNDSQIVTIKAALPNVTVEAWTYKPLVGVTSHIDETGLKTVYEYDGLGRLKTSGVVIEERMLPQKEYYYNYQNLP